MTDVLRKTIHNEGFRGLYKVVIHTFSRPEFGGSILVSKLWQCKDLGSHMPKVVLLVAHMVMMLLFRAFFLI